MAALKPVVTPQKRTLRSDTFYAHGRWRQIRVDVKKSVLAVTEEEFADSLWSDLGEWKTTSIVGQFNLVDTEDFTDDTQQELWKAYRAVLENTVLRLQLADGPLQPIMTSLDSHRVDYLSGSRPVFEGARLFANTRVAATERLYARGLDGWYPSSSLDPKRSLGVLAHVNADGRSLRGIMDGILEVGAFPQWWFSDNKMLAFPSNIEQVAAQLAANMFADYDEVLDWLLEPTRALFPPFDEEETRSQIVPMVGSFVARHAIALALFRLLVANEISGAVYATAIVSALFCRFYVLGPSRIAVDIEPETYEAPSQPPAERPSLQYSEVLGHAMVFKNLRNSIFHNKVYYDPFDTSDRDLFFDLDGFQRLINITQAAVVRVGASNPFDCKPLPTPIQDEAAAETVAALAEAGLPYTIAYDIVQLSLGNVPTLEDRYPWHPSSPARVFGNAQRIADEMKTLNPFNRPDRFSLGIPRITDHRPQAKKRGEPYAGHSVIEAVVDNLVRIVPVTPIEMDALIEAQVDIDIMRYRNDPFVTDSEMAGWYADVGRKNGLKLGG